MDFLIEHKDTLLKVIGYTFAGIVFFFNKEIKHSLTVGLSLKKKTFYASLDYENEINLALQHLLSKFGFNRIAIIEFHNGLESFNGISFRLAKMMYEKTDSKTKAQIGVFKDIPISFLTKSLLQLKDSPNGYILQENDECLMEDFLIQRNVDFMMSDNLMDGIIRCSYYDTPRDLSDINIKEIKSTINKIMLHKKKM